MNNDKVKTFLYSLWLVPIIFATILDFLTFILDAYTSYFGLILIGLLVLIGFLMAALTSKQKKDWIIFGISTAAYFLVIAVSNAVGIGSISTGTLIGASLFRIAIIAACIFAIVHHKMVIAGAFYTGSDEYKAQKANERAQQNEMYMQRVKDANNGVKRDKSQNAPTGSKIAEVMQQKRAEADAQPVAEGQAESQKDLQKTSQDRNSAQQAAPVQHDQNTSSHPVDVNNCSVEELLELPGISLADAQRAVKKRETQGLYSSIDDFIRRNELKPHVVVRFLDRLTVSVPKEPAPAVKRRGRALDL